MNKSRKDIFVSMYPSVDLHGETSATMVAVLNEFINDSIYLKHSKIAVVHGIGYGILKEKTHQMLRNDKRVKCFYMQMCNPGCTIVELFLDK